MSLLYSTVAVNSFGMWYIIRAKSIIVKNATCYNNFYPANAFVDVSREVISAQNKNVFCSRCQFFICGSRRGALTTLQPSSVF